MVPFYENKKQVNKSKLKRESWVEKNNDQKAEKMVIEGSYETWQCVSSTFLFFQILFKASGWKQSREKQAKPWTASGILVPNVTQKQ